MQKTRNSLKEARKRGEMKSKGEHKKQSKPGKEMKRMEWNEEERKKHSVTIKDGDQKNTYYNIPVGRENLQLIPPA